MSAIYSDINFLIGATNVIHNTCTEPNITDDKLEVVEIFNGVFQLDQIVFCQLLRTKFLGLNILYNKT